MTRIKTGYDRRRILQGMAGGVAATLMHLRALTSVA